MPGQELYVFYAIKYEKITPTELNKHFISKITFKGGKGITGDPYKFLIGFFVTVGILVTAIGVIFAELSRHREYKSELVSYNKLMKNIYDITVIIHKAKLDNLSKEFIISQIDNYINDIARNKKDRKIMKDYAISIINFPE